MRFAFPPPDDRLRECLTDREYECVALWWDQEYTQRQVAQALGISPNTVKYHLANARRKMSGGADHTPANPMSLDGVDESEIIAVA